MLGKFEQSELVQSICADLATSRVRRASGGTRVLVPRGGVVASACGTFPAGSSSSNTVEIFHDDPSTGQPNRFLSRYLHLEAGSVPLIPAMNVVLGARIGRINDTGNSAWGHLHFSIHDQNVAVCGLGAPATAVPAGRRACVGSLTPGASVRPTPMDGVTLDDDAIGTCVTSTNVPRIRFTATPECVSALRDVVLSVFGMR